MLGNAYLFGWNDKPLTRLLLVSNLVSIVYTTAENVTFDAAGPARRSSANRPQRRALPLYPHTKRNKIIYKKRNYLAVAAVKQSVESMPIQMLAATSVTELLCAAELPGSRPFANAQSC